MSNRYEGSCHCGAVKFTFIGEEKVTSGLRCTCSICTRKGAKMTTEMIAEGNLEIQSGKDNLSMYQFDTKIAKHYFCKTCGIYTFHETARKPGYMRANIGCFEDVDSTDFEVAIFDGKNLL